MTMAAHAETHAGGRIGHRTLDRMIRLFNAGYGVDRLASILELSPEMVRGALEANVARRGLSVREARAGVPYEIAREELPSQIDERFAGGAPRPTFADHARHVAAVMAAGGFASLSEYREEDGRLHFGLPLRRPVFAGAAS